MANGVYWKVYPKPTGPFRSFEKRGWPSAEDKNGEPLFGISCEKAYTPLAARTSAHPHLELRLADHSESVNGFKWKKFIKTFTNIKDLKKFAEDYYQNHPEKFVNKKE